MENIKVWAAAICLVAIACSMLQMLTPKAGTGRIFRLTVAAFFLCSLLAPLLSLKSILHLDAELLPETVKADVLQERMMEQLDSQLQTALQSACDEALAVYHLSAKKVSATMDTGEDGRIYISHITVVLDKQQARNKGTIQQVLEKRLGTDVEVTVEE